MARKNPYNPERGLTVFQVEGVARSIAEKWKNAPEILVAASFAVLPDSLKEKVLQRTNPKHLEGVFDPVANRAYLIAGNIRSKFRARKALFDVVKGHYGLRGFMGDDLDPFLDQVFRLFPRECSMVAMDKEFNLDTRVGQHAAAEEVVVKMASAGVKHTILDRIYGGFRDTLRKIGFDIPLTESDVRYVAARSGQFADKGEHDPVIAVYQPNQDGQPVHTDMCSEGDSLPREECTPGDAHQIDDDDQGEYAGPCLR